MAGMYRRSMMIYSSLQAKFKGTRSNGRIHRYGAFIFGDIIINVSKPINRKYKDYVIRKMSLQEYLKK